MTSAIRSAASIMLAGLLAACQTTPTPEAATPPDPALDAAQIELAAGALERYCVGGLPDVEAIAIAMSADAGPQTGKAYTPYEGPEGFIGASLRAADGYSANAARKDDGRIVCGVALFTTNQGAFETAVLDRLVDGHGLQPRTPRREADGGVTYALDRFTSPATLSFRSRRNEAGEPAIGAVITVAGDGGALPEPEAPAMALAAAPEPASPLTEPAAPAEIAAHRAEPPAPANLSAAATPSAPPGSASAPAPLAASKPAPSMPKAANPPSLADAPSLYEGAPYSAFTPQQIADFCKQDWRIRRMAGGRTEYNPCYERSAFR